MNLMDELNRLTRRVQQLEANRGATFSRSRAATDASAGNPPSPRPVAQSATALPAAH